MKRFNFVVVFIGFFANQLFAQAFSLGITPSLDLNWYKYFDGGFSDFEAVNKVAIGYSAGLVGNIEFTNQLDVLASATFTQRHYEPERSFSFGQLLSTDISAMNLSIAGKYDFSTYRNKSALFIMPGATFQMEFQSDETFANPASNKVYDITPKKSLMLDLGVGYEDQIGDDFIFRVVLSSRYLKYPSEYLHPWMDQVSLGIQLLKEL